MKTGLLRYGHTYQNEEKRKAIMLELYGITI